MVLVTNIVAHAFGGDWVGNPDCWQSGYSYRACCGDVGLPYFPQLGMLGAQDCWDETRGFGYEHCCLAGKPRVEVLQLQMQGRVRPPVRKFLSADFPDFDCERAPDPPQAADTGQFSGNREENQGKVLRAAFGRALLPASQRCFP
eukprot:TRINITY_DN107039_c0_g1_i1.p1 TRINITY_DN107039_c0_g1~~TRINITY_DN107039_c0_g1_i1.p1  ORF type:complete len:145 (+),score=19.47 TRINITY_DN107039_c0_g1_i1:107-541(+)